jgi:hypothetical protein
VKILKYVKIGIPVLLAILFVLFLHKNLPRTAVVQITGTDVKRVDMSGSKSKKAQENAKNAVVGLTTDVRFINAINKKGKTMVFKNQDTGWGWPPYFKFDSADLTARAQAISQSTEDVWVMIKYYGWRIRIFSMFPNAVSLKVVEKNHTHYPIFNIVFISTLLILGFILTRKIKKRFGKKEK